MRRLFACLVIIVLFAACPNAYKRLTHGFRPAKCALNWPDNPEWENGPLDLAKQQEIQAILRQTFSYFAKGRQCFVFLSQDRKHVLKLFRFDTCKMPYGQKIFYRIKKWKRDDAWNPAPLAIQVPKLLSSCKMTYDLAADLTGLVYIHLNPKNNFLPMLQIKDRLGRTHQLNLAKYRFMLQKTCDPFMATLLHAAPEERDLLVASFADLIEQLGDLGLKNLDPRLACNFGFLEGKAIAIDVGNYAYDPIMAKQDNATFVTRLNRCLQKKLEKNLEKILQCSPSSLEE